MAKFYGNVGFAVDTEPVPGVHKVVSVTKPYKGDILQNYVRPEQGMSLNDDIHITNRLSIIADPYAKENFHSIKWAEYMGTKWKISNVEVQYPRLILTLGGMYNGD